MVVENTDVCPRLLNTSIKFLMYSEGSPETYSDSKQFRNTKQFQTAQKNTFEAASLKCFVATYYW